MKMAGFLQYWHRECIFKISQSAALIGPATGACSKFEGRPADDNAALYFDLKSQSMFKIKTTKPTAISLLPVPVELIERCIFLIRGQKVMLDTDLAELYQVPTKVLNQAVKRNLDRFPQDFMLQLTNEEVVSLRSQFVTSNLGRGGRRYLPYAFTEHGVAMLSSVLNSQRAVQMNILIIRAFVKLREMLATHKDLARKMEDVERQQKEHGQQLAAVYSIVKRLIDVPPKPQIPIGFRTDK
jgi:phage regulator Rha-like protein